MRVRKMTLQHILGILLLVYSVAVAPLSERKSGSFNYYDEEFGYSSGVPGNSGENVPVKFGRTIYHSAWSTEDTESSDENNHESTRAKDIGSKSWSLSNALRLALNFVNKLKTAGSDYPAIEENNENAPKSNILNNGEDAYWPLFEKWLRRNKILKDGDSLSSKLLGHNPRFNDFNHKNYKKKPRKKHFRNVKPSAGENQGFDGKGNRLRNPKLHENNKSELSPIPKINKRKISADRNERSKELSALQNTEERNVSKEGNCHSFKTLNKNKDKKSNNLTKTNKNERMEGNETVLKHPNHGSAKITTESTKKRNNSHDVSKHHHSSPVGKISSETQTISSHLPKSPKQQDEILFPQAQNKTNLKSITSVNYETLSGDSALNQAPVHEQVAKSKKGQNTSQNQNDLNSIVNQQIVIKSFTERPTEKPLEDNQTEELNTTDTGRKARNLVQHATNQSPVNSTIVYSKYSPSTKSPDSAEHQEKHRQKLITGSVLHVHTLLSSSLQPQYKNNQEEGLKHSQVIKSVPSTILTENASPSESQSIKNLKKNSENSQKKKLANRGSTISPIAVKSLNEKTSHDFPVIKSVSQFTRSPSKINTVEEISKSLQSPRNTDTPTPTPANSSLSKPQDENVLQLNSDNLPVSGLSKLFPRHSPHPLQKKNIENESSNIPQITKNASQQKIRASLFSQKIPGENENITKLNQNESQRNKNIPLVSEPISASSISTRLPKVNSKDSQISEKTLQPATIISNSSQRAANEKLKKLTSKDLPKVRRISTATDSASVTQHEKMPLRDSSSNPQNINTPRRNSNNSQLTKKVLKSTMLVNSSFPQTTDEFIPIPFSNDLPVAKTASKVKVPLTKSSLQLPGGNAEEETSNIPLVHDGIITKPLIGNIPKEYVRNPKKNERATNSAFDFPQLNDKHILKKSSEPLTRHEETPLKKVMYQEGIETESMNDENGFESNNVSTEDEYFDTISDESYDTDKFTFISPASTKQNNAVFDVKNSHFEELEMDSYSEMDSDEAELQSNEDKNMVNLPGREDVEKSAVLNTDESSSKYLKELEDLANKKSYISSSVEELADNETEDQTSENGEPKEKFDTFLQYIYNHSNNSFFQSLRKESQNL